MGACCGTGKSEQPRTPKKIMKAMSKTALLVRKTKAVIIPMAFLAKQSSITKILKGHGAERFKPS